jgi:hypothetical protein
MSTVMEMQNLTNYIREILDRMYPHGSLVVRHRTLRVEAHTGLHTMEVLINDIPYPPPFIHLFHLSHPDIVKVTPEPGHTPPRIIIIGKPHAINMAMTGRLLLSVQSSVMEMMRLQLGTLMPRYSEKQRITNTGFNSAARHHCGTKSQATITYTSLASTHLIRRPVRLSQISHTN